MLSEENKRIREDLMDKNQVCDQLDFSGQNHLGHPALCTILISQLFCVNDISTHMAFTRQQCQIIEV